MRNLAIGREICRLVCEASQVAHVDAPGVHGLSEGKAIDQREVANTCQLLQKARNDRVHKET